MSRSLCLALLLLSLAVGCSTARPPSPADTGPPAASPTTNPPTPDPGATPSGIRYVALGDSYTIGTGVSEPERWPNQLVDRLGDDPQLALVANLAVNGYTSADVIDLQLPELTGLEPEFVSLLIGVNDVVQRVPERRYRANIAEILDTLIAKLPSQQIVVVSTPDYTRSPRGAEFGPVEQQRAAISRFNEVMSEEATERRISFVDISVVADRTGSNPALVASDQLHPSGEQYSRWVDFIAPVVADQLSASP